MSKLKRFKNWFLNDSAIKIVTLRVSVNTSTEPFRYNMRIQDAGKWAAQCMKNGLYVHSLKTWFPPHAILKIEWDEKH